jgi:transcriptional adapter 3
MPPLPSATKGKHKNRDGRRSRSRNTTPSSVISSTAPSMPAQTAYLELETSKLLVGSQPQYTDILETLETRPSNLDPKRLQDIIEQLKILSESAEKRVESCERAVRLIHEQMRDVEFDQKERDRQAEQTRRTKAKKEESSKNVKAKKRKERPGSSDGVEIKKEGKSPFRTSEDLKHSSGRHADDACLSAILHSRSPSHHDPS